MSDYVDQDMQFAPFGDHVDLTDWSQLQEEVAKEPWLDWPGDDIAGDPAQATAQQPDDRGPQLTQWDTVKQNSGPIIPSPCSIHDPMPTPLGVRFQCSEEGCEGVSFARRMELRRHARSHGEQPRLKCPVQQCAHFKGFTRQDKLNDHMLAGHDQDELVVCSGQQCGSKLTRDIWAIHNIHLSANHIRTYRTCPMPKCCYKLCLKRKPLEDLREHLIEKHEYAGRMRCVDILARAGYAAATCDFKCPICPHNAEFITQKKFMEHFKMVHLRLQHGAEHSSEHIWRCDVCGNGYSALRSLRDIPEDVHYHRRTILSIFPRFENCWAVWEDVKCAHSPRGVLQQDGYVFYPATFPTHDSLSSPLSNPAGL